MSTQNVGTPRRSGPFLVAVLTAVILNPLNSSTISVALGALLNHFGHPVGGLTWIISGYYLGSAVAQPIFGRLGDLLGHKTLVYIGFVVVILTAIFAPLSPNLTIFVLWRVIQAIGTSMIYPNAIALVRYRLPHLLGRILGWIGMASGIAITIGPALGGGLMSLVGWQAIFWLNVPLAMLSGLLLFYGTPSASAHVPTPPSTSSLDLLGLALFAGTITAGLFGSLSLQHGHGFLFILLVGLGLISLIVVETRSNSPLIPLQWFRNHTFLITALLTILSNIVMYGILYGLPITVQHVRHLTPQESGWLLLAFAGMMTMASPWAGHLTQRSNYAQPLIWAGLLLTGGTAFIIGIHTLPWLWIVIGLMMLGLSFAISNVLLQKAVISSVPDQETGQASGLFMLLRYLGTIISSVIITTGPNGLFLILWILALGTLILPFGLRQR